MTKTKQKMQTQSFTCSNPKCERTFANPIIVQDLNPKDKDSYQACPYCLTEIVTEKPSQAKREKRKPKKKRTEKRPKIEEKKGQSIKIELPTEPSLEERGCPHHFGYLSERSNMKEIPEECMTCEKIVECMLKKVSE